MSERVLERLEQGYRSNGVTQADLEQLQAWQRLTTQQFEERMLQQAAKEKDGKEQQQTTGTENPLKKSQGLEL